MTTKEHDILNQLGYYADDTCFLSLRFTPEQFAIFQATCERMDGSPEEVVTELCLHEEE